jgi:hypothetical protein
MKKVLGTILFLLLPLFFTGCGPTTAEGIGTITFEVYEENNILAESKTITFAEGDTLLGLLTANFDVICEGSQGEQDDTCSFRGEFGTYILSIGTVDALEANHYLAFYINGAYGTAGIDTAAIVDGYVYAFKLETF